MRQSEEIFTACPKLFSRNLVCGPGANSIHAGVFSGNLLCDVAVLAINSTLAFEQRTRCTPNAGGSSLLEGFEAWRDNEFSV